MELINNVSEHYEAVNKPPYLGSHANKANHTGVEFSFLLFRYIEEVYALIGMEKCQDSWPPAVFGQSASCPLFSHPSYHW